MTPFDWYKRFLHDRKLTSPSGCPLYAYKITNPEYLSLESTLKGSSPESYIWDACFVLYSTEWWRRTYDGGPWTWEPILREINQLNLSVSNRTTYVQQGFKRWLRKINEDSTGKDYMGTVVIECGLPLRLLEKAHYLPDIITELYRELGAISSIEMEYMQLVKMIAERKGVPQALQKSAFFELLLQVVMGLVRFNEKYGFSSSQNPAEMLDQLEPGWRNSFPLRVEESVGKIFIERLIKRVTSEHKFKPAVFTAKYELLLHSNCWHLKNRLVIKGGLHDISVLGMRADDFEALSHKLELYISGENSHHKIGYAFKNQGELSLYLDPLDNYEVPEKVGPNWTLHILDPNACKKVPLKVLGGLMDVEEPLIFAGTQNNSASWKSIACGTAKLATGTYRVLVLEDTTCITGEWKHISDMTVYNKRFKLVEIISACDFQQGDNIFSVTFSDEGGNFAFQVIPSLQRLDFYPQENGHLYLGWPKIYKVRHDGVVIGEIKTGLEYQSANGSWCKRSPHIVGKVKIRLVQESRTQFCKTLQVLPDNFLVEFHPSEKRVELVNTGGLKLVVYDGPANLQAKKENGSTITFKEIDLLKIPEYFEIGLYNLEGLGDPIRLKVPFPKQQLYFCSAKGEKIGYKAPLYLQQLHGTRLYITNLSAQAKSFHLRLSLEDPAQREQISLHQLVKVEAHGNCELALISLKDLMLSLLSLTTNPDAKILIDCSNQDRAAVEIHQFDAVIEQPFEGCIRLKGQSTDPSSVAMQAMRLDLPLSENEDYLLDYDEENKVWLTPRQKAVWFIYPKAGTKRQFRPSAQKTCWTSATAKKPATTSLHDIAIFSRNERLKLMTQVFDEMATTPAHPDWQRLNYLYNKISHLPLMVQDAFSALSNHSGAMTIAPLILESELIDRLSQEFGINWFQYPVALWLKAFERYIEALPAEIRQLSKSFIHQKLDWIADCLGMTSLKWILEGKLIGGQISPSLPAAVYRDMITGYLNGQDQKVGLRGRHKDDPWPQMLNDELVPLYRSLPEEVRQLLPVEVAPDQKSVVYLPVIMAVATLIPELINIVTFRPLTKFRIREVIAFDEPWFGEVYNLIQGYLYNKID